MTEKTLNLVWSDGGVPRCSVAAAGRPSPSFLPSFLPVFTLLGSMPRRDGNHHNNMQQHSSLVYMHSSHQDRCLHFNRRTLVCATVWKSFIIDPPCAPRGWGGSFKEKSLTAPNAAITPTPRNLLSPPILHPASASFLSGPAVRSHNKLWLLLNLCLFQRQPVRGAWTLNWVLHVKTHYWWVMDEVFFHSVQL